MHPHVEFLITEERFYPEKYPEKTLRNLSNDDCDGNDHAAKQ